MTHETYCPALVGSELFDSIGLGFFLVAATAIKLTTKNVYHIVTGLQVSGWCVIVFRDWSYYVYFVFI